MVYTSHKNANFWDGGCYCFTNINFHFIKSKISEFKRVALYSKFKPGFNEDYVHHNY